MNLRFSRQARSDLIDIWRGIAVHDGVAADRILDRIAHACNRLREFPDLGRPKPEIDREGRVLVVDRWLVFYRRQAGAVSVIRILDGRRDLTSLLPRPPQSGPS